MNKTTKKTNIFALNISLYPTQQLNHRGLVQQQPCCSINYRVPPKKSSLLKIISTFLSNR